jgi:hypothetical protein
LKHDSAEIARDPFAFSEGAFVSDQSSADSTRLYTVRSYGDYFHCGSVTGARQVIIGAFQDSVVAVLFDQDGNLIDVLERPIKIAQTASSKSAVSGVRILDDWCAELGFSPGPIDVRAFDREGVRITDRPWHYEMFLRDPTGDEPNENLRLIMFGEIADWDQHRRFVLKWGKDYWMNADGSVHSS